MNPRSTRRARRAWTIAAAIVYALSLFVSTWVEALGPAGGGLDIHWPDARIMGSTPGGPMDAAGARAGDAITSANGRRISSRIDWFVARANFVRNEPMRLDILRDGRPLTLWFTIARANGPAWPRGTMAFRAARVVLLAAAIAIAFRRGASTTALLVALMLAVVSVAEAFPPAGWAATLRGMPWIVGIPIAVAASSWLLMGVLWFALCAALTRRAAPRVASSLGALAVAATVFIAGSASGFVYRALWPMPPSFAPARDLDILQSIFGVFPQLFLDLGPLYRPSFEARLIELWLAATIALLAAGAWIVARECRLTTDAALRRRGRQFLAGLACALTLGVHNVLVRTWTSAFGTGLPRWLSAGGFVTEAVLVAAAAAVAAAATLKKPTSPTV